jgi:PAS domain-containing protein
MNMADRHPTDVDGQLHLVLDNMPGALVYTDADLRIVVCNNRFKEMYKVPPELLQPGRPKTASVAPRGDA